MIAAVRANLKATEETCEAQKHKMLEQIASAEAISLGATLTALVLGLVLACLITRGVT